MNRLIPVDLADRNITPTLGHLVLAIAGTSPSVASCSPRKDLTFLSGQGLLALVSLAVKLLNWTQLFHSHFGRTDHLDTVRRGHPPAGCCLIER